MYVRRACGVVLMGLCSTAAVKAADKAMSAAAPATAPGASADEVVAKLLQVPDGPDREDMASVYRMRAVVEITALGDAAIPAILKVNGRTLTPTQSQYLYRALSDIRTPAATVALLSLLENPSEEVRSQAVDGLINRMSAPASEGGGNAILEKLITLAKGNLADGKRVQICWSMRELFTPLAPATDLDPARVAMGIDFLKDRLARDASEEVRFAAACCLTDLGDGSGLDVLKRTALSLEKEPDEKLEATLDLLVRSLQKATAEDFGKLARDPEYASDGRTVQEVRRQRREVLVRVVAWVNKNPPEAAPAKR